MKYVPNAHSNVWKSVKNYTSKATQSTLIVLLNRNSESLRRFVFHCLCLMLAVNTVLSNKKRNINAH